MTINIFALDRNWTNGIGKVLTLFFVVLWKTKRDDAPIETWYD